MVNLGIWTTIAMSNEHFGYAVTALRRPSGTAAVEVQCRQLTMNKWRVRARKMRIHAKYRNDTAYAVSLYKKM